MLERLLNELSVIIAGSALTSEDILSLLISIFLSISICFIVSQVYKNTHYGMSYEQSFMITLVLLGPIISAVMLFIQGSMVVSLALVGSLSIIRFRTPIKDSLDMIYLFWVSAVGIGTGTYNWLIVIIFSVILLMAIGILQFVKYGRSYNRYFVLIINGNLGYPIDEVEKIIKNFTSDTRIRSFEVEDQYWEAIFEIRFVSLDQFETKQFMQELQDLNDVHKVSLLAPQLAMPV